MMNGRSRKLKKLDMNLWRWNETETCWSQTLAHAGHCVFIPTQRHLTCNLDDFCVPSIATTKKEIMFIFTTANMISCWKVEEWTCSLKFWEQKPTLNYDAILAVWLVVSYRLLCNGPQSLLQVSKASFMQGHALACMRWGFN